MCPRRRFVPPFNKDPAMLAEVQAIRLIPTRFEDVAFSDICLLGTLPISGP